MALKGNCPIGSSQVVRIVFLITLAAALAGCSRSDPEAQSKAPPGAILLTGAGATFRLYSITAGSSPIVKLTPKLPLNTHRSVAVKVFAVLSE